MDLNKENSDNLVKRIGNLFLYCQDLAGEAVILNTPIVDSIVETNSQDIKLIEHILDSLLDLAFDKYILILFKKLCRHYYAIDPHSATEYVLAYRDMWDEEQA
jgi:hypothetical protein